MTIYYVATDGSDSNNGLSIGAPFLTVQKGVSSVDSGGTIYVRGGTYRESIATSGSQHGTAENLTKIHAYQAEIPIIKASDIVTGWVLHSGSVWKKTGWTANSQQVFDDDAALQQIGIPPHHSTFMYPSQVGTNLADIEQGSFYVDTVADVLYVWLTDNSDPNSSVMEASVRYRTLIIEADYWHLKGMYFRHSNIAADTEQGTAVILGNNCLMESCNVQWCDFAGVSLGYNKHGAEVRNSIISNNGALGLNGSGSTNYAVHHNIINRNNYRNFNAGWNAGGIKTTNDGYGVVEYNEFGENYGSGVWFDFANGGNLIIIRSNYIYDSWNPGESGEQDGIHFEVSDNGLIYNNIIRGSFTRGIYLSATNDTLVYNNTVTGTRSYAAIDVDGVPRSGWTLKNNKIYNNIIANNSAAIYDLYMAQNNGVDVAGNFSNYNLIYNSTGIRLKYAPDDYTTLAAWGIATGFDLNSVDTDPDFVVGSGEDYAISDVSPAKDAGDTLTEVTQDYLLVARPKNGSYDMGAFEYATDIKTIILDDGVASTSLSTADTARISVAWGGGKMRLTIDGINTAEVDYDSANIVGDIKIEKTIRGFKLWKIPYEDAKTLINSF